jgi:hypothetical protein
MRSLRVRVLIVVLALSTGACGVDRVAPLSAPTPTAAPVTSPDPELQLSPEEVSAQLTTATTDICTLVTPEAVATSFRTTATLKTAAMGEAHGPACGYPNPDGRGYMLVIQFQSLASWDTANITGSNIDDLTLPARFDRDSGGGGATLFVRDQPRNAVVMLLAPEGPSEAVLRVASLIYHG